MLNPFKVQDSRFNREFGPGSDTMGKVQMAARNL